MSLFATLLVDEGDFDFFPALLVAVLLPFLGACLSVWTWLDALTATNRIQNGTIFTGVGSICINFGLLALFGFRFQCVTWIPWLATAVTFIATWKLIRAMRR